MTIVSIVIETFYFLIKYFNDKWNHERKNYYERLLF